MLGYVEQIVKLRVQILFLVSLNFWSAQKEFEGINFGSIHREFGGIKIWVCPYREFDTYFVFVHTVKPV